MSAIDGDRLRELMPFCWLLDFTAELVRARMAWAAERSTAGASCTAGR